MKLFAFILYFVVVLAIGVWFFLREKSGGEKDYFLGGRSMGPFVTAMSAQASDMSGWLLMGFPGAILAFGLGQAWIGIGLALGTAANWIFVAKRLRRFSKEANDAITLPQYLSNRFCTKSPVLQIICAVVFLVFFTIYVASSFVAGGTVFEQVIPGFGPDGVFGEHGGTVAILIFAVILIAYTFLGGFKAVCWTDFFQAIMMLVALLAVPIMIIVTKNLDTDAFSKIYEYVDGTDTIKCAFNASLFSASWNEIASGLAWGLGYFGMPHILVRFMSIKDPKKMKTSAAVAIVWVVITLFAAIVLAYVGRMVYADELLSTGSQKNIFIKAVSDLFPAFIAGILLSAIIAAAMSTADSQLLVSSSSFTSDIYKPVIRKNASEKEILWVGRGVVVVVAIVACVIATIGGSGAQAIMNMVENAWGGFGASFGPVIILSLFWKRLTYKGAVAGVVGGAVTDVAWLLFLSGPTGVYELLPGFIVGLICAVVASLIDKKPSAEVENLFDRAIKEEVVPEEA